MIDIGVVGIQTPISSLRTKSGQAM